MINSLKGLDGSNQKPFDRITGWTGYKTKVLILNFGETKVEVRRKLRDLK
jgi:hypothetical protein